MYIFVCYVSITTIDKKNVAAKTSVEGPAAQTPRWISSLEHS